MPRTALPVLTDDLAACCNPVTAGVSHHMKQLVDAGLLTREQRSKWAYYRVVDGTFDALGRALTH